MDFEVRTRAYSTQRPIDIGTYPLPESGRFEIHNFDKRSYVPEIHRLAWGYIDYGEHVPETELERYEMGTAAMLKEYVLVISHGETGGAMPESELAECAFEIAEEIPDGQLGRGTLEEVANLAAELEEELILFALCERSRIRISGGKLPSCECYKLEAKSFCHDAFTTSTAGKTLFNVVFFGDSDSPSSYQPDSHTLLYEGREGDKDVELAPGSDYSPADSSIVYAEDSAEPARDFVVVAEQRHFSLV